MELIAALEHRQVRQEGITREKNHDDNESERLQPDTELVHSHSAPTIPGLSASHNQYTRVPESY